MQMQPTKQHIKKGSTVGKEVFIGLISIALGAYNILNEFDIISFDITAPSIVANVLLVLGGLFLLTQAYKISRHEYHIKRLF